MNEAPKKSEGERLLEQVQGMSTGLLLEWIAGKKDHVLDVWIGRYELERRRVKWSEIRSWVTIGISVAALIVSIVALVLKKNG
jgi:hypothetical protein